MKKSHSRRRYRFAVMLYVDEEHCKESFSMDPDSGEVVRPESVRPDSCGISAGKRGIAAVASAAEPQRAVA
jgi:hypothetical protein